MKILAVIPARGGSKRLPGKNIIDFFGKPVIAYSIEAALKAEIFERVVVSTEDDKIADIAISYGAEVEVRDPRLATDTARVLDVCLDLLDKEYKMGISYDILCCLYATAPLRSAIDIIKTVDLVQSGQCDFAVAVTKFHFSPHQALKNEKNGDLVPVWPELVELQSQKVPEMYADNGSTYAVRIPQFKKEKTFFGSNLKGYIMPRNRSVDIDSLEDLYIAKAYAKGLFK